MVGSSGLEPPTSRLSGARSSLLSYEPVLYSHHFASLLRAFRPFGFFSQPGGDEEIRTLDPLLAGQVLSQLSYTPVKRIRFHRTLKIEQRFPILFSSRLFSPYCEQYGFFLYLDSPFFRTLGYFREQTSLFANCLHRKEVIQPHLPIRLPCYDLTPIIEPTFDGCLLSVSSPASGIPDFHGLTGGVYKTRERIHRSMLICDY